MEVFLRRFEMYRLAFNHVHQPLHRFNKISLLPHLAYTSRRFQLLLSAIDRSRLLFAALVHLPVSLHTYASPTARL